MAREEKQANIYAIPKNSFDTGYVFGGQFKTRNFVEGVVVTLPFLGIFLYGWAKLGLDFESTVAYCFILCAAVFVSVVHGVGGDSLLKGQALPSQNWKTNWPVAQFLRMNMTKAVSSSSAA